MGQQGGKTSCGIFRVNHEHLPGNMALAINNVEGILQSLKVHLKHREASRNINDKPEEEQQELENLIKAKHDAISPDDISCPVEVCIDVFSKGGPQQRQAVQHRFPPMDLSILLLYSTSQRRCNTACCQVGAHPRSELRSEQSQSRLRRTMVHNIDAKEDRIILTPMARWNADVDLREVSADSSSAITLLLAILYKSKML